MDPAQPYDVAIVGARIGGSVLASYLADAGHRVLLVDRATFPSDTISTHFFRGVGLAGILGELGLLDAAAATGAPALVREYLYTDGGSDPEVVAADGAGDIGYDLSIRRLALDALLLERATRSPSVTWREGTRVTGLTWVDGTVTGLELHGEDGPSTVGARWVIGADGHASLIARLVEAAVQEEHPAIRALYYCYLTDFAGVNGAAPDGAEFSFLGDELAYVFPSDAGLTCLALSINLREFPDVRAGGFDAFRAHVLRHRGLGERFEAATVQGRLLGQGPQRNVVRVPIGPGWALVGDAGMHQDPWTGEGMDSAARSARALAGVLDDHLRGRITASEATARYHAERDAQGLENFHDTVTEGRDLSTVPFA
jgi:2-polyprenyl-6-methoxyphenol hydroxylase-like FAD-dependent oxidoreductase